VVRLASGAEFPGFLYFAACLTGAALWPLIAWLLPLPQRPRTDPDHPSL